MMINRYIFVMIKSFKYIFFFLIFGYSLNVKGQITPNQTEKLETVLDLISMFYVDSLNDSGIVEKAITALLKELDPHSVYISKDKVQEMNRNLFGGFDGIGITYSIFKDTVYIIRTIEDGPADKSGIIAGDRIVSIDQENIVGKNISEEHIRNLLQGKKGTKLKLGIIRHGKKELFFKELERDRILINSIPVAYKIDDDIAYIKLESFSVNTIKEFEEISRSFRKERVQNIILDLRNNGGGYLSTAIRLIDEFMPSDRLIIYTKGKNNPRYDYFSSGKGHFKRSKLVILINENSASASEIVAGAIQDWDRGLIVGRRSFGKGLVQRPFNLPDGSMIRLTVARYYTPTGRLIQKNYANGYENYVNEENNRFKHGELFFKDSIYYVDSLKYLTLNRKRTVYGGGGIIPDIFVAVDTNKFPDFYLQMMQSGKINSFIIDFIDKNRDNLAAQYTNSIEFDRNFEVDDGFLASIIDYAQQNNLIDSLKRKPELSSVKSGIELTNLILKDKKNSVKHLLKALIARDLWGNEAFYKIYNRQDDFVLTAIDVLKNKHLYNSLLANSTF